MHSTVMRQVHSHTHTHIYQMARGLDCVYTFRDENPGKKKQGTEELHKLRMRLRNVFFFPLLFASLSGSLGSKSQKEYSFFFLSEEWLDCVMMMMCAAGHQQAGGAGGGGSLGEGEESHASPREAVQ